MTKRGTGITTSQMRCAPHGAVFIWCNEYVKYPADLAQELGRRDLEIVGLSALDDDRLRGRRLTGLVVDHAAHLTLRQYERLSAILGRVRQYAASV
jgi:hypothetical protein